MSFRAVAAAALLALSLHGPADAQDGAWRDFMPPTRRGATLVHDTVHDRYLMFGGFDTQLRSDVWGAAGGQHDLAEGQNRGRTVGPHGFGGGV
jgi:hypothetical protein